MPPDERQECADVCRDLKNQQQIALRQLRDQRQSELDRCNPRLNGSSIRSGATNSCDNTAYQDQDNDRYHHKKHPDHPYPPTTNPPPMLRTRQSMIAVETDIAATLMQAQRAARAALALHNMALTTTQDRLFRLRRRSGSSRLRIPAPHPAPVRLLDQVPPALPRHQFLFFEFELFFELKQQLIVRIKLQSAGFIRARAIFGSARIPSGGGRPPQ